MSTLTRERNFDLIRLILMELEKSPLDSMVTNANLRFEDYDSKVVAFHLEMLKEAGFIDASIAKTADAKRTPQFMVKKILWEGYEFLDNAKNDTIWKKFKAQAEKKGSSMSMAVANGLLTAFAKKLFELD